MFGWIDNPRSVAIVSDVEILAIVILRHRATDTLNTRIACDDANRVTVRFKDGFNQSRVIKPVEFTVGRTGR